MTIWANLLRPRRMYVTERAEARETTAEPFVKNEIRNRFEENHSHQTRNETNALHSDARYENLYRMEVQISVTNHNEIRNAQDAEALSEHLAESLRDKLFAAAEGVYA